jgi:hypothetical protein
MSNNPTSEKLTFLELIEKFKIEIPIIQRDYAQGREGKEGLRKNFLGALLDAVKGKELELDFVYGSVKDNVLQPLDGQQRLTTLFLLHWFVAVKENKLDDELKKLLIKFTYETRTSSREFCNELINKGIIYKPEQKISEQIIDSSWFFLSWKKDPTIKSMLTMLDDIQQTFKNETEIWEKLNNISFHFIELQNFGLSDDLYIKMNARGKALTDFENFKAKFEQYIHNNKWEENAKVEETFAHKIDTVWTDLFWNYRDKTENIFDEKILNFFRTMAVINYTLKADIKDDKFSDNIDLLRGDQKVSFNQYLDLGCFDEVYFETIKSVLDKISDKNGLKKFLDDTTYLDEGEIFNGMIQKNQKNLSYPDLVIAFAYYQYLASEENIEKENLKSWLRIIRNLVEGSRPYLFNNANEFANAISSVKNLFQHKNSIVKYFAETEKISLSGFIGEQVSEEKLKAKLITQSNDWKDVILEIENHGYFKGQIGFLLNWCKDENGIHNIEKFKEYVEKAEAVFDEKGLKNFGNYYLFERGLLATGDYLLTKGKNHSFLIDNDRDISWKRLLRDDNEKRKILKSLFDKIKAATLKEDLEKIVDDFSDKNDWRYYFIKQPEMIAACGSQKLIRLNNNNKYDILLLGSTTTSGRHKEYYSYSLFVELKEKLSLDESLYEDQRSVDYWKYFKLNGRQIAFDCDPDCKTGRYFWTQDDKWSTKTVFESREKAILELTKGNL